MNTTYFFAADSSSALLFAFSSEHQSFDISKTLKEASRKLECLAWQATKVQEIVDKDKLKQLHQEGRSRFDATKEASRLRLRPIIMTSLAFILGVVPLAVATGAGAEMRQSLGTAVFFGMLGVTLFGLLFTPTFYAVVRRISGKASRSR